MRNNELHNIFSTTIWFCYTERQHRCDWPHADCCDRLLRSSNKAVIRRQLTSLTLFLRGDQFLQSQHLLVQSIQSEAKVLLRILLPTLQTQHQLKSCSLWHDELARKVHSHHWLSETQECLTGTIKRAWFHFSSKSHELIQQVPNAPTSFFFFFR